MSIIGYPPMNYVMRAIWARVMKLGGCGPMGSNGYKAIWLLASGYGYWLCGHELYES
jgi:hypothetical protein